MRWIDAVLAEFRHAWRVVIRLLRSARNQNGSKAGVELNGPKRRKLWLFTFLLVPSAGLEPALPHGKRILSLGSNELGKFVMPNRSWKTNV